MDVVVVVVVAVVVVVVVVVVLVNGKWCVDGWVGGLHHERAI